MNPGAKSLKRVPAIFYRTSAENEPVRQWPKAMGAEDRRRIGEDIKAVEFGWPVGMPVCRPLGDGLHEIRTDLSRNRIARVFYLYRSEAADGAAACARKEDAENPG